MNNRNRNNKGRHQGRPKNNDKRRNRRNRYNRSNKPHDKNSTIVKYQNLLDQHLQARKKYYEYYFRGDEAQRTKLENNFIRTVQQLRDFESKLPDNLKMELQGHFDRYEADKAYSTIHELPFEGDEFTSEDIDDPHFLESQKESDFSEDTEESVGTMDDYLSYKGQ